MKRENNTGTIYKLKGKRRKPWIARVSLYVGDDRTWQTIGYGATKEEAAKLLAQHIVNPISPRANIKLSELYSEWKVTAHKGLADRTIEIDENSYKHLKPLHDKKFNDLRIAHFQKIINDSGLGFSSSNKIKSLVNRLYEYAVQNDISIKNYSRGIKVPKEKKTDKEIFSDTEIQLLFDNDSIEYVDSILILIHTGFRIQEMLSLTKFDVDLEQMIIRGGMKTEAGTNRVVPIHPKILNYVKARHESASNYLFTGQNGKQLNEKFYREKKYKPLLESLGIKYKVPHIARHTAGTLFARAGMDPLAIQKIMGHTDYAFTANVYTHVDIDFLKNEMLKV